MISLGPSKSPWNKRRIRWSRKSKLPLQLKQDQFPISISIRRKISPGKIIDRAHLNRTQNCYPAFVPKNLTWVYCGERIPTSSTLQEWCWTVGNVREVNKDPGCGSTGGDIRSTKRYLTIWWRNWRCKILRISEAL